MAKQGLREFNSPYQHGFARMAVCVPPVRVADVEYNLEQTLELARHAGQAHAAVALFPELGLTAYTNEDLFHQDALLDAAEAALGTLVRASESLGPLLIVGVPLRIGHSLFNCAAVIHGGRLLGVVPKSYLPNYREYYEKRHFAAARDIAVRHITLFDESVPFGSDLLFSASSVPGLKVHVEICEDLWVPVPPSSLAAMAGATVLTNLSAGNITVAKADWRRTLCASQSGRCVAAYLYATAGPGESTTDLAWDGDALIYENGDLLAGAERFARDGQLVIADVDLQRLRQDRMRQGSFRDTAHDHGELIGDYRQVPFHFELPTESVSLRRPLERFPYVPVDNLERDARCWETYEIQIEGLLKRLSASGIEKVVIGVSGGLDSTHALIIAARTMDRLGLPRENVMAYTLPGYATSNMTLENAHALMQCLGVSSHQIDIGPACDQMLQDIGHPAADGESVHDVTYENVQAGQRTSLLFRLANHHNALVLGTGDLSELALGWTTYGVGDQMSHYNVNASVPKTLIQYLLRWVIANEHFDQPTCEVLQRVVDTEISPELVPGDGDAPQQRTEDKIGPYALQDFNLYYISRFGFTPSKVAYLAWSAWRDVDLGSWPSGLPQAERKAYSLKEIKYWLGVFVYRFFRISQFKRSAMPNGPKVGSGGSLSPRGDWRAPSDAEAEVWLAELEGGVPDGE